MSDLHTSIQNARVAAIQCVRATHSLVNYALSPDALRPNNGTRVRNLIRHFLTTVLDTEQLASLDGSADAEDVTWEAMAAAGDPCRWASINALSATEWAVLLAREIRNTLLGTLQDKSSTLLLPRLWMPHWPTLCTILRTRFFSIPEANDLNLRVESECAKALHRSRLASESLASPAKECGTKEDDIYAPLKDFAQRNLKGIERKVVELACEGGGRYPLADMAIHPEVDWGSAWDDAWGSARRRVNRKLKAARLPWNLLRVANEARVEQNRSKPSKKTGKRR